MRVIMIVRNSLTVLTKRDLIVVNVDQVSSILLTRMVAFVLVNTKSPPLKFRQKFYGYLYFSRLTAERQDCEECSGHGRCVFEPTSNEMTCICNKWFAGKECHINLKGKFIYSICWRTLISIAELCSGNDRRAGSRYLHDPSYNCHHRRLLFAFATGQGIHHWWTFFPQVGIFFSDCDMHR